MTAPKLSACCSMPAYWDPICLSKPPTVRRIGKVPLCGGCGKIVGDSKVEHDAPKKVKEGFALAWRLLLETHPRSPYYMELKDSELRPEGYGAIGIAGEEPI